MMSYFRSGFLIALACVLQIQVFSDVALSQVNPPAPRAHDAQQIRKSDSPNTPELNEDEQKLVVQRFIYSEEIEALRWEEIRAQQAIEKGKKPIPEISYSGILTKDEEQVMRTVLLDASHRLDELDRECGVLNSEVHEHYSKELADRRDALDAQRPKIYDDAVDELRGALGEDAFEKVNQYLYQVAKGSGRIADTPDKIPSNN